ncbi:hypothetical protein E4H04_12145 [Candidatus Bathyarchaeota archaeon]|nr:MAG: hypothetical protein E4H04_12145 [Candidatus Bathyarchaeota archaeon]
MINIGMILESSFPPDIRVKKEADVLIADGYQVHLLSLSKEKLQSIHEAIDGIHVERVEKKNTIFQKFSDILYVLTFRNILAEKAIEQFILSNNIDVVHVTWITINPKQSSCMQKIKCKNGR